MLGKLVQFVGRSSITEDSGWVPDIIDVEPARNHDHRGEENGHLKANSGDEQVSVIRRPQNPNFTTTTGPSPEIGEGVDIDADDDAIIRGSEVGSRPPSAASNAGAEQQVSVSTSTVPESPILRNSSYHARIQLQERGLEHSSLVSLGLYPEITSHWAVKHSREYLKYFARLARHIAVPDSAMSGVIRVFVGIVVVLSIILALLSLGNHAQMSLELFPRTIDLHVLEDGNIMIDHRVVNATLFPTKEYRQLIQSENATSLWSKDGDYKSRWRTIHGRSNNGGSPPQELPYYASCEWRYHSLQLIDFALLSDLAYFDEPNKKGNNTHRYGRVVTDKQEIVDILFPHLDFIVRTPDDSEYENITSASEKNESCAASSSTQCSKPVRSATKNDKNEYFGPRYIEIYSPSLNTVILALRGTDIGRFHDFMEDIKLYAEPVIFSLLSSVFVTIRFWSGETMSSMVKLLCEFNTFFGLQSESNYYRPLAERVREVASRPYTAVTPSKRHQLRGQDANTKPPAVVLTGHSLGGGLARIVGTLTHKPSVTFSPPGLGVSYKKYSLMVGSEEEMEEVLSSKGAMHDKSMAVVTEFDWVSQIDRQVGLVQQILCDKFNVAHLNACHLMEETLCHLVNHCGDQYGRFSRCVSTFDMRALVPSLLSHLWDHIWIILPFVMMFMMMLALAIVPELL
jgi:hypothetical protein